MQDKQKVTLYLPPELHRQLKIQSAVTSEAMSALAERALSFYLTHSEVVEQYEGNQGQTHRIYNCPSCTSPAVLKDGEMIALGRQSGVIVDDELATVEKVPVGSSSGEKVVVPC